jgi:hypothetical protein
VKIDIETVGSVGLEEVSFYLIFTRDYWGKSFIENDILPNENKNNKRMLTLE